jgi:nascent polypeptide-associated complex subunit alpha
MQGMMKQMGITQEEIDASKVIIEKTNGNKLIIENPSVTKMKIQGNEMFQIIGESHEESAEKFSEKDIQTIMEKTGCSEKKARESLEKTGDIAEAILELSD